MMLCHDFLIGGQIQLFGYSTWKYVLFNEFVKIHTLVRVGVGQLEVYPERALALLERHCQST